MIPAPMCRIADAPPASAAYARGIVLARLPGATGAIASDLLQTKAICAALGRANQGMVVIIPQIVPFSTSLK